MKISTFNEYRVIQEGREEYFVYADRFDITESFGVIFYRGDDMIAHFHGHIFVAMSKPKQESASA